MKTILAACAFGAVAAFLSVGPVQARVLHHHHGRHLAAAYRFGPGRVPAYAYPASYAYPGSYAGPYGYAPAGYGDFGNNPSQEPLGSGLHDPYLGYYGPGSIVLNRTEQARREPGATLELAPDAKETATGGPVGGVPGFDGN